MIRHLYIHFPFCRQKCPYCDFFSVPVGAHPDAQSFAAYGQTLAEEWRLRVSQGVAPPAEALESVYFGGGSPSLFPMDPLRALAETLSLAQAARRGAEVSIELNPEQVTAEQVAGWMNFGFNRFSLGVQSLSDRHLATLGRTHTARQVLSAIDCLRAGGDWARRRLSLDLIYAIPGQSLADWGAELDRMIALRPDHLSAYGLTYYEGLALTARRDGGGLIPATDDLEADMFEVAHNRLTEAGYGHYEISNYALPGAECRHNRAIWRGEAYLGLGAAAHSRWGGRHFANLDDVAGYLSAIARGEPAAEIDADQEDDGGPGAEAIDADGSPWIVDVMLRLRTADGLDLEQWPEPWRRAFVNRFGSYLENLASEGLARWDGRRLALTVSGWLVYNAVMRRFMS